MLPITVITPTYNAARFLRETIDSVIGQKYPALEYIVVDDGSTDDTPDILASYGSAIRILRQPNAGEQAAVNAGVKLASNDIVAVVNADDPIRPGLLARAAEAFAESPELVGVYPDWVMIDEFGKETNRVEVPPFDFATMLLAHLCFPGPGTFFRLSALDGALVRDPEIRYSGDFLLWLRLGLKGPMRRLPGYYATWRQHAGGTSAGHSRSLAEDKIKLVHRFFSHRDLPEKLRGWERQALSAAYYRAALHAIHNPSLPGRRWILKSYLLSPFWPRSLGAASQRSLLRTLFVFTHPLSLYAYRFGVRQGWAPVISDLASRPRPARAIPT